MRLAALRIRDKITIAFILLTFAGISATAMLSVELISKVLEQRFEKQLVVASELLSRTNFARSTSILQQVKVIIDADLLTIEQGSVVASTLNASAEDKLLDTLAQQQYSPSLFALPEPQLLTVQLNQRPYTIAYQPLPQRSGGGLVIIKDNSDIAQAQRAVTAPIILIGVLMALLISLLSHLLTRSLTAPLQTLAKASKKLAAGDWNAMMQRETSDEVGELASALNEMATELRHSEEKLLRSEKLSMTGYLAARIAHDIRNPLFSIKMRAQMICDRLPAGCDERISLEPMLQDIEQVEWVIQGLLDLANPAKLQRHPESVNAVVEETLESLQDQLAHARITISWQPQPGLPLLLLDAKRLRQVLLNLLINAAEAMPEGGAVQAMTGLNQQGDVFIEIADTGTGIAAEHRDNLFDPFFTTKREGVGLGLVNASSLIASHGGSLSLLPREHSCGTRALITLPVPSEIQTNTGGTD